MRRTFTPIRAVNRLLRNFSLFLLSFVFVLTQHLWLLPAPSFAQASSQIAILNSFTPNNNVIPGTDSVYRLTFRNSTGAAITISSLNHTLAGAPGPITITSATPTTNTCGGTGTLSLNSGTAPNSGGGGGASGSYNISTPGSITIPAGAPGQCIIEFSVRGFVTGNHTDTINAGDLVTNVGTNADPTSATLQVRTFGQATLNKAFAPNTIPGDGRSLVTITVNNPNDFPLNGTTVPPTLVDALPTAPSRLFVDTRAGAPAPTTTCAGGTATIATTIPSNTSIQLTGGTIPANGSCTITFPVTSAVAGAYTNTIPVNTLNTQNRISNSNVPSAALTVQTAVTIAKTGLANNLPEGTVRRITITVSNGGSLITGLSVTDPLPPLLEIAPTPDARTTCIAGGVDTAWATQPTAGATTFTLNTANLGTPAIVPASDPLNNTLGTCTIQVNVRTRIGAIGNLPDPEAGNTGTNTIAITNFGNDQGRVPPANATNTFSVIAGLNVTKAYFPDPPAAIAPGSTARVRIRVQNRSQITATGVSYTDNLPTGGGQQLVVADPPNPTFSTTVSCGSPTLTAITNATSVAFSNGTIPPGATCEFFFNVFAPVATSVTPPGNNFDNLIPNNSIANDQGLDSNGVTNTEGRLTAVSRVSVTKVFNPPTVSRGRPSQVTIRITNNRRSSVTGIAQPLNGVTITDPLPANLQVANPPNPVTFNTCSGTFTPISGSTSVSLTGGFIAASSSCELRFNVIEIDQTFANFPTPRTYSNTPTSFGNSDSEPATLPTADLVVISPLSGTKTFQSPSVSANGTSRATIQFNNTEDIALTNLSFTDSWTQTNTIIATVPNFQTTCAGGTFSAIAARSFTFSGGTVPAAVGSVDGICTVSFDVTIDGTGGAAGDTFTNTLPPNTVTTAQNFSNPAPISGTLTRVINDLTINKSFAPNALNSVGDPSVLTITIQNPGVGGITATNLAFVDTMATEILVFPTPTATTTCGGTVLLPTNTRPAGFVGAATLGVNEFGLVGATLNAGATCTITIRTTRNTAGNRTNTLPANSIRTREGTTNSQLAQATLNALPALNVSKDFAPSTVAGGQISRLTVTIQNRQTTGELGGPLNNIRFTDDLPANVRVAGIPNATTTCTNGVFNPVLAGSETTFTLQGFELPFNTTCTAAIDVVSNIANTYTNTIPTANVVATLQTSIGGGTTTSNGPATANLVVTSTALPPEVVLVKRITRINNTDITGFDDGPGTEDNDARWPSPTSDSLRGVITRPNVRPQDDVEYTIYYLNRGQSNAGNLRICDPVPANTSFIANAFNGSTPTDGGSSVDLGIALQTGTTLGDRRFLTGANDAPDRGRYYDPALGEVPAAAGLERCPDPNNPAASITTNANGIVAVNVTRTTGAPTFPAVPSATAAGTPPTSYGFVRFRVKVR
jgi:uncharacterized repeat protein (TIGR01451 family)